MQDLLFSIGGFVLAIGILVTVHEYGHYLAARLCDVKVLKFSVGFGKSLWSKVSGKDQTEYTIAAIPLGGYVKMLDEAEDDVDESDRNRAFNNQPLIQRAFIVIAGPLANFLFAIFAYTMVNIIGEEGFRPVVEYVKQNSIAEQAGFEAGDKIVSVDGRLHQQWDDNRLYLFNKALSKKEVTLEVESIAGDISTKYLDLGLIDNWQPSQPLLETTLGLYPFDTQIEAVVGGVLDNSPAAKAGLEIDDKIISIDGTAVTNWQQMVEYVSVRPEQVLSFEIRAADGSQRRVEITTELKQANGQQLGRIGISNKPLVISDEKIISVSQSPISAFSNGVDSTWQMSLLTVRMLWKMLKLEISPKNISGPITIAEYAGKTAQIGLNSFLLFLAVISISLGIINLLPIPMLDGGHLMMYCLEAVKGGPLSENSMILGQKIGLLILGALMFLAFYNDIARLVQ